MVENMEKMTLEAFQRKLWTWLEEKGIFSQMKTQLRRHMIDVLKSSEIGDAVTSDQVSRRSLSPKYKAINLLIAEYFLKQGYQYALSIFSVEDPTLSVLPEHMSKHYFESGNGSKNFKFAQDDVWDIFETLGCFKNVDENQEIYTMYVDESSNKPLIVCLLRYFSELMNKFNVMNKKGQDIKMYFSSVASQTNEINTNGISESKSPIECNNEVFQNMQIAFDQELRIIKENERRKHLNDLKMIESKFVLKLKNERNKFKEREIMFKKKISKEFENEFQKIREKERLQEMKNERSLQRELEIERQKLFEEYKLLAQKKNVDSSTLTELQQASLEAAMKAVQHQSNRLRKKEDTLDKALLIIREKETKTKTDFSCQYSSLDKECDKNVIEKKYCNEVSQTIAHAVSTKSIACQTNLNSPHLNTSTKISESVQTIVNNSSIHCQTDMVLNINNNQSFCDKSIQTTDVLCSLKNNITLQQKKYNELLKTQTVESMQNLIKNLQNENVQLKYEIRQQQVHIDELLNKHYSMHKEVTEARLDAQELSTQVIELEKTIDLNFKSSKEKYVSPKRDCLSIESKIEKLKSKRTDIKFTDEGVQKIKETLKMLEREGEELEKSFREFKLRQLNKTKSSYSALRHNTFSREHKNGDIALDSPSSLLKQLKEDQTHKCYTHIAEVLPRNNNDYICNYSTDEYSENRRCVTGRAFQYLMNFDKDILHNYITLSKDVKMYNPKNPKVFADLLKERNLSKRNSSYDSNDLKAMTSIRMPKSNYPIKISPKLRYARFGDNINIVERKYQMKNLVKNDVQFVSSEPLIQKQNFINTKKEYTNNSDLNIKTASNVKKNPKVHTDVNTLLEKRNDRNEIKLAKTITESESFSKSNSIKTVTDNIKTLNGSFLKNKTDISMTSKIENEFEYYKMIITQIDKKTESAENDAKKKIENCFTATEVEKREDIVSYEKNRTSEPKIDETDTKNVSVSSKENDLSKYTSFKWDHKKLDNDMKTNEIKILDNQMIDKFKQNNHSDNESSSKETQNKSIIEKNQEVGNEVIDSHVENISVMNNIINDCTDKMINENSLNENLTPSIVKNLENSDIVNTKNMNENNFKSNNVSNLENEISDIIITNEINLIESNEIYVKKNIVDNISDVDQNIYRNNKNDNEIKSKINAQNELAIQENLKINPQNEMKIQENLKTDIKSSVCQNDSEKYKVSEYNTKDKENISDKIEHEKKIICNDINYEKDFETDLSNSEIMDDKSKNNADGMISVVDKINFETSLAMFQDKEVDLKSSFENVENFSQKDKSDELIILSSLDDSVKSQISIPQDSEGSDSFWK